MKKSYPMEYGHALLLMLTVLSVFLYLTTFIFILDDGGESGREHYINNGGVTESCVRSPVSEICEVEGFERKAETCSLALDQSQSDCLRERGFISSLSGRIKFKSKTEDGCIVDTWCFKYCEGEVFDCH